MFNKKILFLAILLISLLSISAVSAAEDASSDISSTIDDVTLEETVNEELFLEDNDGETKLSEEPKSFTQLNDAINGNEDDYISLDSDYVYTDSDSQYEHGINITRNVTINGNGCTIDGNNAARIFQVQESTVVFQNINFINGKAPGDYGNAGAIWVYNEAKATATNCNFTNNHGTYRGGATHGDLTAINCTFTGNGVSGNKAERNGGAMNRGTAINCTFIDNTAEKYGQALYGATAIFCIFENNDWYDTNIVPIYLEAPDLTTTYNSGDKLLFNITCNDEIYDGLNTTIQIYDQNEELVGTYYALSGEGLTVDLIPGTYKAVLSLDKYAGVVNGEATITISKFSTEITAAEVTATYNVNKDLVIALKGENGEALSGEEITVDLNGAKTYTTDGNGEVKIAVGSLVPDTYTVKISFAGNDYYLGSDATAKVTVKKATPKITASAKTFTFEDKTKKYTVTLKDNKGNALKNTKVTLKVNGKTYTATTNSKGVATFKLSDITKGKKLTKKATYNAVISFAGDKYYNKVTKNVKLSVKAYAWKTVAKGSKDKAMVKKIQRALKKNHFYISFKGRYLKIDGIYHKYTVMAVKEFQRAKKLKVTGKVDEATAKKLKVY